MFRKYLNVSEKNTPSHTNTNANDPTPMHTSATEGDTRPRLPICAVAKRSKPTRVAAVEGDTRPRLPTCAVAKRSKPTRVAAVEYIMFCDRNSRTCDEPKRAAILREKADIIIDERSFVSRKTVFLYRNRGLGLGPCITPPSILN